MLKALLCPKPTFHWLSAAFRIHLFCDSHSKCPLQFPMEILVSARQVAPSILLHTGVSGVSEQAPSTSRIFVSNSLGNRFRAQNRGLHAPRRRSRAPQTLSKPRTATTAMARSVSVKEGVEVKVYKDSGQLGQDLAGYVAALSEAAIRENGTFTVALSGGSLINNLGKLSEDPFASSVDFSKWHVFWADERVVPLDHPDSNYKLAYDGFLSKVSIPPSQVHAINETLSPQAAAGDYELSLRQLIKTNALQMADTGDYPRFDLILLGMGPDGHIASLFPHHPVVHKTGMWIASIEDSPKPPPERITFTLPVINSGANVAFVAAGSDKADMIKTIFGPSLPFGDLPAQLVDPYKGHLVWFTDEGAVSKLGDV